MIVSFDIENDKIINIETFDNYDDLLFHFEISVDDYSIYNDSFDDANCTRICINDFADTRIIWLVNDNNYYKHTDFMKQNINFFKQSEWYINYMRIQKLNRILY